MRRGRLRRVRPIREALTAFTKGLYSRAVRALGRTRVFAWAGARLLHRLDLRFRKHPPSTLGSDFPLCYLTVRGRKSGVPRTVPLLHVRDGERVVLIASNWGRGRDPGWALNLAATHEATVALPGGEARLMRSRPVTPDERVRYWSEALRFWPGYEKYRSRAGREIPMFTLDPADAPEAES